MPLDGNAAWKTYTRMCTVETAVVFDFLAQFVGRKVTEKDVEPVTWAVIQRGRSLSATDHASDIEALRQLSRAVATDLNAYDIFVTPTLTQLPRPLGFYDMSMTDLDAYNGLWTDATFQFPFNFSGLPAISLPLGQSRDGIPVGVQLVGRYGDEATVLAASAQLEQAMPWKDRRPAISA
jgi:amidase